MLVRLSLVGDDDDTGRALKSDKDKNDKNDKKGKKGKKGGNQRTLELVEDDEEE